MKVKVCSPDGNTNLFDIVASVLPGETLAPYLFMIFLDNVLRTLIDLVEENDFTQKKSRSRRCSAETITDTDYADDIELFCKSTNLSQITAAQSGAGSRIHWSPCECRENGAICFNQEGDISTLNSGSLKLVDKFSYLGSSVLST